MGTGRTEESTSPEPRLAPGEVPEPHVLVVEDDGETRRLLVRFLRESGLRATGAADGREMLQADRKSVV